jgi:DNA recombination protein RmuC
MGYMSSQVLLIIIIVGGAIVALLVVNLYLMLKSRRSSEKSLIEKDQNYSVLHQRLDSFSEIINKQLENSRQSSERASLAVHQQVQGFTQGMTQLHENLKNMHESVKSVASFQDILKAPKTRGMWGELSLEFSLSQYFAGSYKMQHYFQSGEAVDAILTLPNSLILPIDSKFSLENFERMIKADNDIEKDEHRKQFISDMKKRVDEIATKYILPSEGTSDFALMYIPAEAVYYEVINNLEGVDIPTYARSKKVGIVSPNTFYLTTAAISHWYKNVEFNNRTMDIMKRLERIITDGQKLDNDFRLLGKHLTSASSSYESAGKRLGHLVDRVQKVVKIGEQDSNSHQVEKSKNETISRRDDEGVS